MVDEFRVWDHARSAQEIGDTMRTTIPQGTPGLVAYYRFDEATGGRVADLSNRGHDAILGERASLAPVQHCCPADFDGDGTVDFLDYNAFVGAFETGSPLSDFDLDGAIDFFDYDAFVMAFEAGC